MSFKDNLSKIAKTVSNGASSVANNVAKKSSDLVEVSKLSVSVASEEDKIKNFYNEIGKLIYEKFENEEDFKENLDEDILDKCNEIRSIKDSIVTLKEKMKELKNIKVCPNCKTEMKLETQFCPKCGEKQEMPKKDEDDNIIEF